MNRVETRDKIVKTFREHFKAMRVHCPYPVMHYIHGWIDCGELADREVDDEFYCGKHADILINVE
jgi:hypothetical protein